jgi:hypothetical protein
MITQNITCFEKSVQNFTTGKEVPIGACAQGTLVKSVEFCTSALNPPCYFLHDGKCVLRKSEPKMGCKLRLKDDTCALLNGAAGTGSP